MLVNHTQHGNKKLRNNKEVILPFAEKAHTAYLSYLDVKSKIEDYYLRCRLAAFDAEATAILNALVSRIESISNKDLNTEHGLKLRPILWQK
jgi:hypothetical protein